MKLAELELFFAAAATSGRGPIAGLAEVFAGDAELSVSERLAIYNRAFFYRQLDALSSVFTATKGALGGTEFARLGLAYLAAHPSDHPAVERVGRLFPEYLAECGATLPEAIADLAALEWARLCALVAPNPSGLARPNAVEPATFAGCRVKLAPSLSWLELDERALSAFDGSVRSGERARCGVAVWRAGPAVVHVRLEPLEFQALCRARAGDTMAEICAVFDTGNDAADVRVAFEIVSAWYAREWLESVEIAGA